MIEEKLLEIMKKDGVVAQKQFKASQNISFTSNTIKSRSLYLADHPVRNDR
jgi:hypothetical protein